MDQSRGFIAQEADLTFYNAKAILNLALTIVYDDSTETNFGFAGYVSAYLRVYDDRERTQLIKNFTTQISRNSNVLVLNCSVTDMTFEDQGTYYFELGYSNSGYEVPLRYGKFMMI